MAERPWMPMYWGDYLADTLDLQTEEHGVYLLLIGIAWRRPDGALPNDLQIIKRMLGGCCRDMHGNRFNRIVPPLLERFWTLCDDGKWRQKRVEKELEKAKKRSRNASESARKRWDESRDDNVLADAAAMHARARQPQPHKDSESTGNSESESPQSVSETTSLSQTAPQGANGHKKPKSQDKGTRLSEGWKPSEDAVAYCRGELGCSAEILNREYAAFMDWGLSATGPPSRKRNWDRAFVNWIRRVINGIREQEARERRRAEAWRQSH